MNKAQIIEELSDAKPYTPDKKYRKLIAQYLDNLFEEIANEVEGTKVGVGHPNHVLDLARRNGYNQALNDIKEELGK